jgi:hypothetical protein
MPRTLIETAIVGRAVRMRLADHADSTEVGEWIENQVNPQYVVTGRDLFDDMDSPFVAEARLAALRHAQTAIGAEIDRLARLADRLRR